MTKKNFFGTAVSVALLVSLLAGCGSNTEKNSAAPSQTPSVSPSTAADAFFQIGTEEIPLAAGYTAAEASAVASGTSTQQNGKVIAAEKAADFTRRLFIA